MHKGIKRMAAGIAAMILSVCMMMSGLDVSAAAVNGMFAKSSKSGMTRLAKGADALESHKSIQVYDFQKKNNGSYTYKMSKEDIALLKNFSKQHFTENMSPAQKVAYTAEWIHRNVTYASTSALWGKIAGKSWVEAIFKYQTGQCVQYNGALVCMMAYLGYNSSMVKGYRTSRSGYRWQHYWAQVDIGDTTYLMEAGNRGKSGNWYYLCAKYSETQGYVF